MEIVIGEKLLELLELRVILHGSQRKKNKFYENDKKRR